MPTNPDREALLEQIETDHQKIDLHLEWAHIPDPSWACGFCQEDWPCAPINLATALREEMEGAAVSGAGCRTHPEVMGRHCDACMDQARANLRRVAEATRRDIGNRIKGEMKREHSAAISAARLAQIVETDTNIDAILAQLDAEQGGE